MDDISPKLVYKAHLAIHTILRVLDTGPIHGRAAIVSEYEAALAAQLRVPAVVAVNSGTSAIELALRALNVASGDVLVPAYAPLMTALPVLRVGARPVFYDCRPNGLFPDLDDIRRACTPETTTIITFPAWGYPFDYHQMRQLCDQFDLHWVDDAAQAHGSTFAGRPLAYWTDASCYSTHERKLVTTGEGGFVASRSHELIERVRTLANYGGVAVASETGSTDWQMGHHPGGNLKLPAISAALGLAQVAVLAERLDKRRQVAAHLAQRLSDLPTLSLHPVDLRAEINGYCFLGLAHPDLPPFTLSRALHDGGIRNDVIDYGYRPLFDYPLLRAYARHCPRTRDLCGRLVTLPCHENIGAAEVDRIASLLSARKSD